MARAKATGLTALAAVAALVALARPGRAASAHAALMRRCAFGLGIRLTSDRAEPAAGAVRFCGVVSSPLGLGLAGVKAVLRGEEVELLALDTGNIEVRLPRQKRQHVLVGPRNGGWWPFIAADLGFRPDDQPRTGAPVRLLTGTVRRPLVLVRLGIRDVRRGDRLELLSPLQTLPGDPKQKRPKHTWAFLLLKVRTEKELGKRLRADGTPREAAAACRLWGIRLDAAKAPAGDGPGPADVDHAKTTLTGWVDSAVKLSALEIEDARAGDRVHLVPHKNGWKLLLLEKATPQPVLFSFGLDGRATLVQR